MEQIPDWPLLWRELVEAQARGLEEKQGGRPEDAWAQRARTFGDSVKKRWEKEDSSRRFLLDLLKASPGSTVLDIGAGTGSWACMLAPHAARVTALEPSAAMIAIMEENIRGLGITNVEIVRGSWPDAAVEDHDFSLCSHAIYGEADFPAFVRRMDEVTKRCCLLLMRAPVPDGPMAAIARKVWGQPYDSPNFQVGYNILLGMGIFANVLMEDTGLWKPWTSGSLEEALIEVKRRFNLTGDDSHDAFIARILEDNLVRKNGGLFWPPGVCSALVYWHKQTR